MGVAEGLWAKSTDQVNNHKATYQLKDKQNKTRNPAQKLPSEKTLADATHAASE
jgi:hypothetical protein